MLFTDPLFLFYFLPVTLLVLRLANPAGRLTGLGKFGIISATLVFYAFENWLWVFVFLIAVAGAYVCGWALCASRHSGLRRLWLGLAIAHCLLVLSVFKYLNWLAGIWPLLQPIRDWLAPGFGTNGTILLPPGISFYVFEAISYCFDIYRRKIRPPANPLDFLCFIAMFPRFIAGPIVRYADLEAQIQGWAGMRLARGLSLFAVGFSIKSLFADQFAVFVPYAFSVPQPDFLQAWVGVISYSFQLYFDFWAYSIMATGLGLCLGFEFPDNFRSPYHAKSLTQFWRQWHISLSSWLRDYLYIPLGGSRCAPWRGYLNLLLTMLLGGIWHGANFTFAVWGFYHGLILALERAIGEERLGHIPSVFRHGLTLFLIVVGWTLFRSNDFSQATDVFTGLLGAHGLALQFNSLLIGKNVFAAGLAIIGIGYCIWGERWLVRDQPLAVLDFRVSTQYGILVVFLLALLVSLSSTAIPFLYFQF